MLRFCQHFLFMFMVCPPSGNFCKVTSDIIATTSICSKRRFCFIGRPSLRGSETDQGPEPWGSYAVKALSECFSIALAKKMDLPVFFPRGENEIVKEIKKEPLDVKIRFLKMRYLLSGQQSNQRKVRSIGETKVCATIT